MNFKKIILAVLVWMVSVMVSCKKEDLTDDTYFGSKVMILGHKGMGTYYKYPGNSIRSFLPAIGVGADGCEMDVQLTKDSCLVLFHDFDMSVISTCAGRIHEKTLQEVLQCRYKAIDNDIFLCTPEELFNQLTDYKRLYFSFECKVDLQAPSQAEYQQRFLRAIKRVCEQHGMTDQIFIEAQLGFLKVAKSMGLKNKMFMGGSVTKVNLDSAQYYGFTGLSSPYDGFELSADEAHKRGLYLMCYTPNSYLSNMETVKNGADIIQTDDLISILKRFERYNYEYRIP